MEQKNLKGGGVGASYPIAPIINQYFGSTGGTGVSAQPGPPEQRSSPPERAGDDDSNMRAYLTWLALKYPMSADDFEDHKSSLAKEGWGFSDLKEISPEAWKGMKIGGGFVKKIMKDLKTWSKQE